MVSGGEPFTALKVLAALVMGALSLYSCWLLSGRKFPRGRSVSWAWWVFLPVLWGTGGTVFVQRYAGGLGTMTHLTDRFPWGIWISFDLLCGIALAAGGFLTAGSVYIFRLEPYHPILRPAVLTAYLGYLLAIGGLLVDLGRPYNIWHPMIYWQHRSVMFEVAWCVILYTFVLTLEFLPILLEKLRWEGLLRVLRSVTIPVVIAGIVLSTLHQSSLGSLFLIVPQKLLPLWYSPLLPVFFFLSAFAVGFAMLIFESTLSAWAFRKNLEGPIVLSLGRGMVPVLLIYLFVRLADLTARSAWSSLFQYPFQATSFLAEMGLLGLPIFCLLYPRWGGLPRVAFWSAVSVILGVVLNRLNVAWFGLVPAAGVFYTPSWQEVTVTLNLLSIGVVLFGLVARYLPLFEHAPLKIGAAQPVVARTPAGEAGKPG